MKLNPHHLGIAGAVASAVLHTAGTILMQLAPEKVITMSAAVFSLNSFGPLIPYFDLTPAIFVSGLVQVVIYSYIFFYVFGFALQRLPNK